METEAPYSFEIGNQNGILLIGSINSSSLSYSFSPIVNGVYYFVVQDDLGCVSDTVFYNVTFIPTSNYDHMNVNSLQIYPNPSKNIFNIRFVSENSQELEIKIRSLIGEEVYSESLHQFSGEYMNQINLYNYPKGVYMLEIKTQDGIINSRLILQ